MSEPRTPRSRRALLLLLSSALGVALVGFLTGTQSAPEPQGYRPLPEKARHALALAPRHRDIEHTRYARRAEAQQAALAHMQAPPRAATDEIAIDPKRYAEDVAARRAARAYDGAPPTIPHSVDQRGAPACLACHAEGMRVPGTPSDKIAKPMSHPLYASCLQCHATRDGPLPAEALLPHSVSEDSTFTGLDSAGRGMRAYPGAPPQMPHRSFMRERCASCHGVWATGLASTHPWRQSCTQCHTPAADADQVPSSALAAMPALGASP